MVVMQLDRQCTINGLSVYGEMYGIMFPTNFIVFQAMEDQGRHQQQHVSPLCKIIPAKKDDAFHDLLLRDGGLFNNFIFKEPSVLNVKISEMFKKVSFLMLIKLKKTNDTLNLSNHLLQHLWKLG